MANPFAVLCLDSNERLYRDEYCVFYGNTESPNKEIRFIREDDYEEAFSIVLDALPIEIEHIIVIVSGGIDTRLSLCLNSGMILLIMLRNCIFL